MSSTTLAIGTTSQPKEYLETSTCYGVSSVIREFGLFVVRKFTDTESVRDIEIRVGEVINQDCVEFCNAKGLKSVLNEYIDRVKQNFSCINKIIVELDHFRDYENEDTGHVVIRVKVGSDQSIVIKEYDEMVSWIAENIPSDKSECFAITVKRV